MSHYCISTQSPEIGSSASLSYETQNPDPAGAKETLYATKTRQAIGWIGRSGKLFQVLQTFSVPIIDIDVIGTGVLRLSPALKRVIAHSRTDAEFSARVYMTAGGLRLIVTTALMPPHENAAATLGTELGADLRYMRMCRHRGMYAARLEPKIERCEKPASEYATTCFLDSLGNGTVNDDAWDIVVRHDLETRAYSGKPLA